MATSLHAATENQGSEADVLLKWKASLDNESKPLLSSWIRNNPCGGWKGITCDESKSVYKFSFKKQLLLRSCSTPYRGDVQSRNS
ncbi:hypothetical protein TSUD_17070 [Trifolium subterraneum]|uniref:Leucine-rich repeat-containing N-terminal plant-type domain-containing protein n=1 Tax=Trifolium subterraneum TaxID=3900 RepID=A0A2Z6MQ54_TRISU|nr:hypothetical protein TSUD_17070 [Trifolium subterraneum]